MVSVYLCTMSCPAESSNFCSVFYALIVLEVLVPAPLGIFGSASLTSDCESLAWLSIESTADDFCWADWELFSGNRSSLMLCWLLRLDLILFIDLLVSSGSEYEFEDFLELVNGFSRPSEFLYGSYYEFYCESLLLILSIWVCICWTVL